MVLSWLLITSALAGLSSVLFRELFWRTGWVEGTRNLRKNSTVATFTGLVGGFSMLAIGHSWNPELYLFLSLYIGLLVSFSAVDVEEKVIPRYVWGAGLLGAVMVSVFFPEIIGAEMASDALFSSIFGGMVGGGVIFFMVELGKLLFGRVKIVPDAPQLYSLEERGGVWFFVSGGESISLTEVIMRRSDHVLVQNEDGTMIKISETTMDEGTGVIPIKAISGVAREMTIPREAMGFGDVKFMIMAGAMTGWQGGVFAIFAGAVIGSIVGGILKFTKGNHEIPFVPFLSAGMVLYFMIPSHVKLLFDIMMGDGGQR